jgi:hypothetical protein
VDPAETGLPAYHPSVHLKLYIYGYLNRVQSSRRLEREASRNLEVIGCWADSHPITRRLPISERTTASHQEGVRAVRGAVPQDGAAKASVAIDGSKFKAVNNRGKNFTKAKVERRRTKLEYGIARSKAAVRQARSAASRVGSTRTYSRWCRSGSTKIRALCARVDL